MPLLSFVWPPARGRRLGARPPSPVLRRGWCILPGGSSRGRRGRPDCCRMRIPR